MYNKFKSRLTVLISAVMAVVLSVAIPVLAKREKVKFVMPDTASAETDTNRYSMYSTAASFSGNRLGTAGFEKKLENASYELWFSEETASVRLVDKASGYIWGDVKEGVDSGLNEMWDAMARSAVTVVYLDDNNMESQISLSDEGVNATYSVNGARFIIDMNCDSVGISISFAIELKDDRLEIGVIEDSIKESSVNKLSRLYMLPFFGSTLKSEMDGYFFVPDGSGALIRFDRNTNYESPYTAKFYGKDVGIDQVSDGANTLAKRPNDYLVEEYKLSVPVYGTVHGNEQYAAMAVIESGEEYATASASLAGETINYNWLTAYFDYRKLYSQPVSKANSVIKPQDDLNPFAPKVSYYFLSGKDANYNGMALKYRSILENDGVLKKNTDKNDNIPLRLDVVVSDIKKGFLSNSLLTFTTAKEAENMLDELSDEGINNVTFTLCGWLSGGLNGSKFGTESIQKSFGGKSDLSRLKKSVTDNGGRFYLQLNPMRINETQGRLSYVANTNISKQFSYYLRDNDDIIFPYSYVVSPQLAESNVGKLTKKYSDYNFNLSGIGSELCSDYGKNRTMSRSDTKKLFGDMAAELAGKGKNIAYNTPNVYLWNGCTDYFDIPMINSQYIMETDSVPFLQTVLRGYINYYASYANQGFSRTNALLRTIEYGAYPSFMLMDARNDELTDTPLTDCFTLCFDDWKPTMVSIYNKVNGALKSVQNASITEHKTIAEGLVRVKYDNGVSIYVNYNSGDCSADGVTVKGLDYLVRGN